MGIYRAQLPASCRTLPSCLGTAVPCSLLQGEDKRETSPLPYTRAQRDAASASISARQEKKTEETVKLHLYVSSTGTEQKRPGAIAKVPAKDGSNDKLAHGSRLREGSQDLWELPCTSSPPTASTASKQKKIKCSAGGAGVSGHAHLLLPQNASLHLHCFPWLSLAPSTCTELANNRK